MMYVKKMFLGFLLNRIRSLASQKPLNGWKANLYIWLCDKYMSNYMEFVKNYGNLG